MSNDHYHLEIDGICLYCHIQRIFDKLKEIDGYNLKLAMENHKLEREIEEMDKSYKKIISKEKGVIKATKKVLDKDEARDKLVKAGKKAMKGKC